MFEKKIWAVNFEKKKKKGKKERIQNFSEK